MKPIKLRPRQARFRCDYCKYSSTENRMVRHESICWKNPDRYCENCENTGQQDMGVMMEDGYDYTEPCYFCSQYNPDKFNFDTGEN